MNNYILTVYVDNENTGFCLWLKTIKQCRCANQEHHKKEIIWKPIWINNYNFKKYDLKTCLDLKWKIRDLVGGIKDYKDNNTFPWLEKFDLYIERGIYIPNLGRDKETLEHLRGFIAGQFNKDIFNDKDKLISPKEWKNWYLKNWHDYYGINSVYGNINKWNKKASLLIVDCLIKLNNWDWDINIKDNYSIVDAVLIGWYVINKKLVK